MNMLKYTIKGLNCEACIKISTMKLKKVAGVHDIKINLATGETEICAERQIGLDELNEALHNTGFTLTK